MPAEVTPDIDPSDIAATIHDARSGSPEALRSSETRRGLLEAFGAILSDGDIDLNFETTDGETARVELGTSPPTVYIPTWKFEQPVTDIERKSYDQLIQQTLTVHEIGHVNYTDNAAFGKAKQSLPADEREAFHTLFNVLEDGAIEEQLRGAFNVADEIAVTNANFRFTYDQDHRTYDMLAATQLAGLDLAVFDSGLLGDLLDPAEQPEFVDGETRRTFQREVLPKLAETSADVLSEPNGERRVELILELWRDIREHFDSLTPPQQSLGPKGSVPTGGSGTASDAASADALGDSSSSESQSSKSADGTTGAKSDDSDANGESQSQAGEHLSRDTASGESPDPSSEASSPDDSPGDSDGGDESAGADRAENSTAEEGGSTDDAEVPEDGETGDIESSESGRDDSTTKSEESDEESSERVDAGESQTGRDDSNAKKTESENSDGGTRSSNGDETGSEGEQVEEEGEESTSSGSPDGDSGDRGQSDDSDERGDPEAGTDQASSGGGAGGAGGEEEAADEDLQEQARRAAAAAESKVEEQEDIEEEVREGYEEAAEEFVDLLDRSDRRKLTIETPTEPLEDSSDRWRKVQRDGKQVGRVFEQKLKNERRSSRKRHQRRGQLDPRSLTQLRRGSTRIFQSDESPDEKDYSMVLVLDRSGSMSSNIVTAERAVAVLAYALESVGVDVCIIDMYNSRPKVAKPFTVDLDTTPAAVLTGKTGGGTPLSDVLAVARKRVSVADSEPAMIVVTDGKPKDEEAYRSELRQTRFPVLGVYIDTNASSHDQVVRRTKADAAYYDQRAIVVEGGELLETLESMAREVMF